MIYELLSEGTQNAMTGKKICALLNITTRDLMAAVEKERREGKPICANTGKNPGYYLAADKAEMRKYCKSLYHRAGEIFKTRRACIKTISALPGEDVIPNGKDEHKNSE